MKGCEGEAKKLSINNKSLGKGMMQSQVTDFLEWQDTAARVSVPASNIAVPTAEMAELRTENKRLTIELNQLRLQLLDLEHKADTDPLVPVYNRRAFIREVNKARTMMARYDLLSSVVFFDLNDFKTINDRYGHSIGDQLLREVGDVLLANVRSCDLVARLGGDEFGVLLFKSSMLESKAKAASLACRIAEVSVELPTTNIQVSSAWGVSPCEMDDTAEQILARADRAMYVSKREGKSLAS